ncbi:MAG: CocE/NonD family hydrolase [Pirellulales bacterium]
MIDLVSKKVTHICRQPVSVGLTFLAALALSTTLALAQPIDRGGYIKANYSKQETRIKMRDGAELHTTIFSPQDKSQQYPIIISRTPYSCRPYGEEMHRAIGPSAHLEREGFIFVKQDVRGRWNSSDKYDNMRPHVPHKEGISESSDTYDTIEWLINNIPGNNGKVGITGISYPGFYSAAALPEHHPALVASSPQAPIADFFFDDFHHQGAYTLMYWSATPTFGYQHNGPTTNNWTKAIEPRPSGNAYDYFLKLGSLKNSSKYFGDDCFFWKELASHPNYDEFWQRRSILPHLGNVEVPIKTNVMTVGGWFDAEDLFGPLQIYRQIEKYHPNTFNVLVMGPWSHGQWSSTANNTQIGYIDFGQGISDFYQREVELPYFNYFLKEKGSTPDFEALVYDTGLGKWDKFDAWPPKAAKAANLFLGADKYLGMTAQDKGKKEFSEFVSDPANPVPYRKMEDTVIQFTPRQYMTDDQRFASARPDVLVFESQVLDKNVTLVGPLTAVLNVSTTQSDADWIVKLIDVYPDDTPNQASTPKGISLAGYQQKLRSEVFRSRFRNSYSKPEPLVPNQVTEVRVPLQDVYHTFKKGHKIMVQVQSSWFPLIDRNPQKYVENIFEANDDDFVKATHRVYHAPNNASRIEMQLLPGS